MPAIDTNQATSLSNTITQSLKTIKDTAGDSSGVQAQKDALTRMQSAMDANKDILMAAGSTGWEARLKTEKLNTLLQSSPDADAVDAAVNALVQDLNASGIQTDLATGEGHYDAGTRTTPSDSTGSETSPFAGITQNALQTNIDTKNYKGLAEQLGKLGTEITDTASGIWNSSASPEKLKTLQTALSNFDPKDVSSKTAVADALQQFSTDGLGANAGARIKPAYDAVKSAIGAATGLSEYDKGGQSIDSTAEADPQSFVAKSSDLATMVANKDYAGLGDQLGAWGDAITADGKTSGANAVNGGGDQWKSKTSPGKMADLYNELKAEPFNEKSALLAFADFKNDSIGKNASPLVKENYENLIKSLRTVLTSK